MSDRNALFARRQRRARYKLRQAGGSRPRLSVFRSGKHIYAQVIDDRKGATLAAASSLDEDVKGKLKTGADKSAAVEVGKLIAARAIAAGVKEVVFDDQRGRVGHGAGKAREVPEAIRKATEAAKRGLIRVPLRDGRTLHHDVKGRFGAGKVTLRAAPAGTGIIAGGPMRAVFETLGIKDIVAKSVGTSNPHNMIKATFVALQQLNSPRMVATRRGKKVGDLLGRRDETTAEAAA